MITMNIPRQDLKRCLRRQGSDKVHVDFVLCDSQISDFEKRFGTRDYESYFGMSHRRLELEIRKNFVRGPELYLREILPGSTEFDEYGIGHSKGSEFAFHMTRMHHPLKGADIEEIRNYPYPAVDESKLGEFRQKVLSLHSKGLASFAFMQMTVWEASWYLRSMEELMIDMMT
jgi:uroporphyrinogen decarboxylase